jgi:NAD(P)-dependent dehydrogenase (short-subunit alcohol dehydrogenase family)
MSPQTPPVALVTGVSSGIGKATADLLSRSGYRVYGTVRKVTPEAEAPGVSLVTLDVRDQASVRACVQGVIERETRIDALVNNAGLALTGSIEETTIEQARELFETNVLGLICVTLAVLPTMRRQKAGRIVNIGSIVGLMPAPFMGLYAATKHAVEGCTESLDHEVRSFGIRASVVEPSFTRTKIASNALSVKSTIAAYDEMRGRAERAITEQINNGADPIDVARTVLVALRAKHPKHRYAVGAAGAMLSTIRRFAPAALFDWGMRKQFNLDDVH